MSPRRIASSILPMACESGVFGLHVVVLTIGAPMVMVRIHGRRTMDGLREIAAVDADGTAARHVR